MDITIDFALPSTNYHFQKSNFLVWEKKWSNFIAFTDEIEKLSCYKRSFEYERLVGKSET